MEGVVGSEDTYGLEDSLDAVGAPDLKALGPIDGFCERGSPNFEELGATDGFCELGAAVRLLDVWVGDIEAT